MAALPDLMTVAQFRELPEGGEFAYELHCGVVVRLTRPKPRHWQRQRHIERLLESRLKDFGPVCVEVPFRPVAEFDLRAADVAVISWKRWNEIDPDDDLRGAPDLVIEVKSPSNRKGLLQQFAALCLANGAREFWVVDTEKKSVSVVRGEGAVVVYRQGSAISLGAFGGGEISVDEIFG
jgi:Uma2 family endonuclease